MIIRGPRLFAFALLGILLAAMLHQFPTVSLVVTLALFAGLFGRTEKP